MAKRMEAWEWPLTTLLARGGSDDIRVADLSDATRRAVGKPAGACSGLGSWPSCARVVQPDAARRRWPGPTCRAARAAAGHLAARVRTAHGPRSMKSTIDSRAHACHARTGSRHDDVRRGGRHGIGGQEPFLLVTGPGSAAPCPLLHG